MSTNTELAFSVLADLVTILARTEMKWKETSEYSRNSWNRSNGTLLEMRLEQNPRTRFWSSLRSGGSHTSGQTGALENIREY